MRIEAADYVEAAKERLTEANLLYEKARYSLALYVAGVAVESLLRAYIVRVNPRFEAAHDLYLLLDASNLHSFSVPTEGQQIFAAITMLFRRWRNDLRYTSDGRLRRRLKKSKLDRGIRGDFLKENCRIAIEAAKIILKIGVAKWKTL
ncbi:HEPN domain-containing protein [candidate division KSB1 bacterium]|nr:HEPN domain-containing protein [candidate division KSB1 bacterium]